MSSTNKTIDLRAMAHEQMLASGFTPDMEPAVMQQINDLKSNPPATNPKAKDLRNLLWSSIDNNDSMDLDQIEYSEQLDNGNTRVLIGIADVDSFVPKGSPIDQHAEANTTSVYLGVIIYPMLPEQLSNNLSSLLPDVDRPAIVFDLVIDPAGNVISTDVYRATVRNHAKLAYASMGKWFDSGDKDLPNKFAVDGLEDQLNMQRKQSDLLHDLRIQHGALNLETIEAQPVAVDGKVVDITTTDHNNPARDLIENLMVAANSAMATLLDKKGTYSIRRIVKQPKRWDRIVEIAQQLSDQLPEVPDPKALADFLERRRKADPDHFPDLSLTIVKLLGPGEYVVVRAGEMHEGHFGLAVHDYTHSTAPNRRFPDLVTQRLLKAVIDNQPCPYSEEELQTIARRCTEMGTAANKVERFMRKAAAAQLLCDNIGQTFKGIVTGAKEDGIYVRISHPSAEGRLVKGQQGVDVGDRIKVRLLSTDPSKGFIDFQKV